MASIAWADVEDHAPELSTIDSDAQTTILAYVNATTTIEPSLFDGETSARLKLARIFLAAHVATTTPMGSSGAAGPVTAESAGRISRSYASVSTTAGLATTAYGVAFDEILQSSGARAWIAL